MDVAPRFAASSGAFSATPRGLVAPLIYDFFLRAGNTQGVLDDMYLQYPRDFVFSVTFDVPPGTSFLRMAVVDAGLSKRSATT